MSIGWKSGPRPDGRVVRRGLAQRRTRLASGLLDGRRIVVAALAGFRVLHRAGPTTPPLRRDRYCASGVWLAGVTVLWACCVAVLVHVDFHLGFNVRKFRR